MLSPNHYAFSFMQAMVNRIEIDSITPFEPYMAVFIRYNKIEREGHLTAAAISSSKRLLIVYPFKVEEEMLQPSHPN